MRLLDQLRRSTGRLTDALSTLDPDGLVAESALAGWSRLTVACHLRYGATALRRMTLDAQAGRPTAFYPEGRASQRPATLRPGPHERPEDVIRSLATESTALQALWDDVTDWDLRVQEPPALADLGPVSLRELAILRLTEVEVHSTDLDIGLGPWSDVFVDHALPMRLGWLPSRHRDRPPPPSVERAWLFVRTDGDTVWRVAVSGGVVSSAPATVDDEADVVIAATGPELLGLLLGRHRMAVADEFLRLFPGP